MSTERKILIAIGAILIAGMISVACFSLGVYVGAQGWTLQSPSLSSSPRQPGQGQRPPGAPGQPGRDQPQANRPTLIGVVRQVDEASITVNTDDGPRVVTLTERTRYARRTEEGTIEDATFEDVQPDVGVAILGPLSQDGRALVADAVILLPPREP